MNRAPAQHRLEGRRLHADVGAPRQRDGIRCAARRAAAVRRVARDPHPQDRQESIPAAGGQEL